ncbi:ABC transporter substrate-binding protein [Mesorhizobium sp.]|uniref:ABC transporter substrate-binding protein n=1 Tax=Mesorhizobium sp. TaxID=1871066 RepID=UPI000FEA0B34|nr:ABC transporter substrate-binding protein [Mesorhizobium sp.]RWK43093.1 MAG: ABC transporter substrate-binding protein [Mesorhizobium sp.]RWK67992.1 MAG: ABC transporter substrate-binding protein [Mesorhizobium sp.]RWK73865.1 MAG: ABC transporter substrate-binding protein [Mesorhizobium sp.]RWK81114.1 MAG: ABC transporter substrate-binding protein [Mesorhizobium sp.]RWL08436.1 MAG: ABC transporter substrate-binding protein [Mesorhizobium sp.]
MKPSRRTLLKGFAGVPALLSGLSPATLFAQEPDDHDALRVAIAKPAGSLDPHKYIGLWAVQDLIFEPLIRYGHGGQMKPALATEWTLDEGGKLFRLKLRENVTFQDGTPWDASAMIWNLDRWMGKDAHNWMNASRLFDGHRTLDSHTVEIRFKEPVLGLLYEFSYVRPSRFLSPKSVNQNGEYVNPVGTGPWIEESATNTGSDFKRFDGYWGDRPAFEHIELKVLPDSRSRLAALRAGEIDISGGDFLAPIKATEAKTLESAGIPVVVETGTMTIVLGFNPERNEALKDIKVRKAINVGFDRTAIAKVLFQSLAEPAGNLFPPSVPMSGKRFEVPGRDPDAAKALLEEAGWTGSGVREKAGKQLSIEIVVSEEQMAGSRALGEILQAQLGEIGIELTIRSVDHASRHSDIPARKFDMALFYTLGAPYEPFGTLIGMLLSTFNNGVDGKLAVDAEHLDPLLLTAASASEDKVEAATQAVYDWLHQEVALLPLFFAPVIWAHSERVTGFAAPATEYDLPYENVTLSA